MVCGAPGDRRRAGSAGWPRPLAEALDALLEVSILGSFSRLGYLARRAAEGWEEPPRVDGAVMVVTGASSGIGRAVALDLGRLGAEVWVLGRDRGRTTAVAEAISSQGGRSRAAVVDLSDGASVDAVAERLSGSVEAVDGLVHCAGSLLHAYERSSDGSEMTLAVHLLGPFRLTWRLRPLLGRAERGRIVTMSSGGMYTERFDLDRLEAGPESYDGVRAYARAKRAQVVLAAAWSRRLSSEGVASCALHPGWVDTPGLSSGLPSFRLGPLLRRPEEGADTALWLVTGGAAPAARAGAAGAGGLEEGFFHDRRRRGEHYLPWTRPPAGEDEGSALWAWCAARTGLGEEPGPGRPRREAVG